MVSRLLLIREFIFILFYFEYGAKWIDKSAGDWQNFNGGDVKSS